MVRSRAAGGRRRPGSGFLGRSDQEVEVLQVLDADEVDGLAAGVHQGAAMAVGGRVRMRVARDLQLVRLRIEVGDGRRVALAADDVEVEHEGVAARAAGHGRMALGRDQGVVQRACGQGVVAGSPDYELGLAGRGVAAGGIDAGQGAAVALGGDEGVGLDRGGVGVAQHQVRQRGVLDVGQGLRIEALVLEVEAVAVA